jgi:threonine/homoserine/homoserine lactone efflux protein
MFLSPFWKAFSLTFAMLCAIGPICITVINSTIVYGFTGGLSAAFGVVLADWIYIAIAVFFLEIATQVVQPNFLSIIAIPGLIFLFYVSYKFWITDVSKIKENKSVKTKSNFKRFGALFIMTITGPTTIFSYSFIFSNFINDKLNNTFVASDILLGASFGTFSFYLLLVSILSLVRKKMTTQLIAVMNKFASIIIFTFGITILFKTLQSLGFI